MSKDWRVERVRFAFLLPWKLEVNVGALHAMFVKDDHGYDYVGLTSEATEWMNTTFGKMGWNFSFLKNSRRCVFYLKKDDDVATLKLRWLDED